MSRCPSGAFKKIINVFFIDLLVSMYIFACKYIDNKLCDFISKYLVYNGMS